MRYLLLALILLPTLAFSQSTQPTTTDKLPYIHVDLAHKRIAVDCEAIDVEAPLEFLCVVTGGNEHESILRTPAKPSNIHLALLMLGLEPGKPLRADETKKEWLPPTGPALQISVQYEKDGKQVTYPAWQLMRDIKTKKTMPPQTWVFVGSKVANGQYAADITSYVVSVVNFELTPIDVPYLASSSNELLEWEVNPDTVPPKNAKCTMILEPAKPTTQP